MKNKLKKEWTAKQTTYLNPTMTTMENKPLNQAEVNFAILK